jgi:hypothetical protein
MTGWPASIRRNWMALALTGSLVLNAFLVGMLVAESFRGHRDHRLPRYAGFELRRLADRLPADAVDRIAADLQALGPVMAAHLQRIRQTRAEIGRLVAAPQPDRAAIDARLAELRAESAAMQEAAQRATYDAVLALPADLRAGLAEDRGRR